MSMLRGKVKIVRKIVPRKVVVGNNPVVRVENGTGFTSSGQSVFIDSQPKPFRNLFAKVQAKGSRSIATSIISNSYNKYMKLTIELVPKSCWFSNVRSHTSQKEWDVLRKDAYKKASYKCEICSGKGKKWPVECHEIWDYDDKQLTQKLIRMTALCPSCHEVKHMGLARVKGNYGKALKHLMKVNDMTKQEATDYVDQIFEVWAGRSEHSWKLDITFLDKGESDA